MACANGDMVTVTQALHRFDEIQRAAEARTGGKDYPLRSSMEAIGEGLRAIMAGKYDKA
jgi:hypothetical protein